MTTELTLADLEALKQWDTPTICNALEVLTPERRTRGFTVEPLLCAFPDLPPIVGYARTVRIRSMNKQEGDVATIKAQRLAYYQYVQDGPTPSIIVLQDIDPIPGFGSFWGEVQSNIHKGLGALGTITNGCVRDIDACAEGFQFISGSVKPSHAWVHTVDFDVNVTVCGMEVSPGDVIHADRHGCVIVPDYVVKKIPATVDLLTRQEAVLIEASQKPGFSVDDLREAFEKQADIH